MVNQLVYFIPWRAKKDKLLCDLKEKHCRVWEVEQAPWFTTLSSPPVRAMQDPQ
jgi:hypothetical protein